MSTGDANQPNRQDDPTLKPEDDISPPLETPTLPPDATLPPRAEPPTHPNRDDKTLAPNLTIPTTAKRASSGLTAEGYEILDELGRGGMGVVYKARDTALNRIVALKMILAGVHASEESIARFRTEAEAVAQLQHRGIVQVFDVGQVDGQPYCALEFVPGGSLDQLMAAKELSIREWVAIVEELAHAMSSAHQAGIVHRDLKPANVLIATPDSGSGTDTVMVNYRPKITDFGLAKKVEQDSQHTQTGAVMGTPSYMAPEQARGVKRIGPAADIYSLGAILFHLTTGEPPFSGASPIDTIMQVIDEPPPSPRGLNPAIDRDLNTIILKCLEKKPTSRYASAEHLAQDLRRYQLRMPIDARPVSTLERLGKWALRKPFAAGLIALSVIGLVGVIVGGAIVNRELVAAYDRVDHEHGVALDALTAEQEAVANKDAALKRAEVSEAESRRRLVDNYVTNALQTAKEHGSLTALPWLSRAIELEDGTARLRAHQLRFNLALLRSPTPRHTWPVDAALWECRFSADGRRLAAHSGPERHLRIWDLNEDKLVSALEMPGPIQTYAIDETFTFAIVACDHVDMSGGADLRSIGLWDLQQGERIGESLRVQRNEIDNDVQRMSPTTGRLARRSDSRLQIRIHDLRTNDDSNSITFADEVADFQLHSSGKYLAAVVCDQLKIVEVDTKRIVVSVDLPDEGDHRRRLRFYGDHLVLELDTIRVLRIADGKLIGVFPRTEKYKPLIVALSPAATGMAIGNSGGNLELFDKDGSRINQRKLESRLIDVKYSESGDDLFVATPFEVLRFSTETGEPTGSSIPATITPLTGIAISPNDRSVAISSGAGLFEGDGCLRVWTLRDGTRAVGLLPAGDGLKVRDLIASPDGQRVIVLFQRRGQLAVVDIADRSRPRLMFRYPPESGEPSTGIRFATWHPSGGQLAIGLEDGQVELIDAEGHVMTPIVLPYPSGAVFNGDGSLLAIRHGDGAKQVAVANSNDGSVICDIAAHRRGVMNMAFSPDDARLVTVSSDLTMRTFDLPSGKQVVRETTGMVVKTVAFAADHNRLLIGGSMLGKHPGQLRVVNMTTGEDIATPVDFSSAILASTFSADGRLCAACDEIGNVTVMRTSDGGRLYADITHPDRVTRAQFSRDGKILLTVCKDLQLRLFDVVTGVPLGIPVELNDGVSDARFLSDTYDVIVQAGSGVLWRLDTTVRTPTQAGAESRFLTGRIVSHRGDVVAASSDELRADFQSMADRNGSNTDAESLDNLDQEKKLE